MLKRGGRSCFGQLRSPSVVVVPKQKRANSLDERSSPYTEEDEVL